MRPRPDPTRQRGLTLVESLVTLGLTALIALLLLQGLGAGRNVWSRVTARAASADAIEAAQSVLRDRITRTYPSTRYDAPLPYPDFAGAPDRLAFTAPAFDNHPAGGLRRFVIAVDTAGDLILSSRSDLPGAASEAPEVAVLLRHVGGLEMAYLDDEGGLPVWRERWDRQPRLPLLVRLSVTFRPGDRRWWPSLLIHPMATVDGDCVLADRGARCAGRG